MKALHAPIQRERVRLRLEACAEHPITTILAPAGYGKTIALTQYLATLNQPSMRYEVRPAHGTLLGFVRGFADVVKEVAPDARRTVADAVAGAIASEAPGQTLALWMANHLRRWSGILAIDDFHHAEADPICAEFLVALIDRTKAHSRWIIASRSAEHLPLSSWLVYGDAALPVGEDDLRFTPGEAADAAAGTRSTLAAEDVDRLLSTTAGWATAFMLALRVSEYSGDVQTASATARQLSYEYLAEQVYRSLSPQERALLAIGALLPDIDVEVLEKAGFDRARIVLEGLQRRASFLSVVPANGSAGSTHFRCHSLFRDFLVHELELQGEEASNAAHIRAASALRACGHVVPALELFAKARATHDTLELLELHGFELTELAHGDAILAAIATLPERERAGNPVVVGLRAQLDRTAGRYDQAAALFERAIARSHSNRLTAMLLARLAGTMLNLGKDPAPLLEPLAFDRTLAPSLRGELLSLLGVAHAWRGRHDGLDRLLDEIEAFVLEVDSPMTRAQMLHQLGTAAVLHGDSQRANRVLNQAAEIAMNNGMFKLASLVFTSLSSNAATNDNDLPRALLTAKSAGDTAVKSGELFLARYAIARQLDICVHRGDRAQIVALLRAYAELPGPEHPQTMMATLWAQSVLAAWDGKFGEACRLQLEVCRRQTFQEERMLMYAFYALLLQAAGQREEALEYVRESIRESKTAATPRSSFGRNREIARALCALTEALAGRGTAADRLLRKKPLVETPTTNALLACVATIVAHLPAGVAVADLAESFEIMRANWFGGYGILLESVLRSHETVLAGAVTLTPAERHVFRSLADGRTPKEIAAAIGCSIHTVRWHIRQGIAKLGCSGREQALRAAFARGLL